MSSEEEVRMSQLDIADQPNDDTTDDIKDAPQDSSGRNKCMVDDYIINIDTVPIQTILDDIKSGKSVATSAVANICNYPSEKGILQKLMKGGLVTIVLELLSQCDSKSIAEVLLGDEGINSNELDEEYVSGPEDWVEILINIVRNEITNPSLCIEVAENIQPLMKCVCDEEKKQLFQSDVHWENTVGLVLGRLSTALVSKNIESTHVLLKNEGEKVIRKMLQRDIKDAQHFQSTILSDLSRIVFHFKDGIPEDGMPMPNDTMFAYAFEAGLLQMCLKNLVRFSNTGNDEALMVSLDFILSGAIAVMFNDKSSKAIAKVYADVVLAVKEPDVRALEKNSKYEKVVKQVLHILGTNIESLNKTTDGSGHIICNTCKVNLEVEGRAIKRCGGCKKVTYCSVECQKADWKAHKEHCRKRIVDPSKHNVVNLGSAPLASHEKMAVHSENVLQAAQAVFNEGIIGWLKQANADGLNILDCLIIIDFREHLPHASVMTQEEFIGHDDYWGGVEPCPPQMKSFLEGHHAKMTKEGSLLALCLTLPPQDKALASGRGSMAVTPAPFGGHFFPGGWPAYQASLR